jgi:hypothetical protein
MDLTSRCTGRAEGHRVIDRRYNPTQRTLNRLLRPFNLRLSLARIETPKRRHAA